MLNVCMISCILFAFMILSLMWFPNMVKVKKTTVDEMKEKAIGTIETLNWNSEALIQEDSTIQSLVSVKLVDSSAEAVLVMSYLSSFAIQFYKSIFDGKYQEKDNKDLLNGANSQGKKLLIALKTLSKKVDNLQDAELALITWFNIAKTFKDLFNSAVLCTSRSQSTKKANWIIGTKKHTYHIFEGMKSLVRFINDSESATSVMTKLFEICNWKDMTSKQLELLVLMIQHLSERVTDLKLFISQLCSFLIEHRSLTSDQINRVLPKFEKLITPDNAQKYTSTVIYDFCYAIWKHIPSPENKESSHLTQDQLNKMLHMLQCLIKSVSPNDDAVCIARLLSFIEEGIAKDRNDNMQLFQQIVENFKNRVPRCQSLI